MKRLLSRRRHPLAGLIVLALALVAFGGVYSALMRPSSARAETENYTGAEVAQGKALFLNNCASCHGENGEGQLQRQGTVIGPSLIGVGAAAVDFQVMTGRMPAANQGAQIAKHRVLYSQRESNLMAAFVASLAPGPAIPSKDRYDSAGLTKSDVARGGELFRSNCAQCHGASGNGGALSYGKYAPAIKVAAVHIYEAMQTAPQNMPEFSDSTIAPSDKKRIIGYIESMEASTNQGGTGLGRLGTVPEGLVGWVVGIGSLVAVAVWLGVKGVRA